MTGTSSDRGRAGGYALAASATAITWSVIVALHRASLVEPDLPLLAGVLAEANAYLGGDSGISHLAAAAGTPSVILYPQATQARWAPWSRRAIALPADDDPTAAAWAALQLCVRLRGRAA